MLVCKECGKIIVNVDPVKVRYGRCASCANEIRQQEAIKKEK